MIFVIHHYDRRLLKKSLHISFLLKWEFGGAFSHPVRHRARVTPLVGGKRQGRQKVIYQVHSHANIVIPLTLALKPWATRKVPEEGTPLLHREFNLNITLATEGCPQATNN